MRTHGAPVGRGTRRWITALALLNAVTAAAGAASMSLGALSLEPEVTARLPWGSPLVGGIALLMCVAVPNATLAALSLRDDDRVASAAVRVGLLLVVWILVEMAFIRDLSFFHPLYVGIGMLLVVLGGRLRVVARIGAEHSPTASGPSVSGGVS